ncbi:MAG: tetratricopeptide repeat protein [Treponema sp.]|nr:tetratricopeptide repeat protein [Treponema sp.]
MKLKISGFWPLVLVFFLFLTGISVTQVNAQSNYLYRYQNGIYLYNSSRWNEAAAEFRRAQEIAANMHDWSQAIYWVILSELGFSDYGSAVMDMDELEKYAPNSSFSRDMVYHRARVYFNLGYFDDALLLFRRYIDSVSYIDEYGDRVAAAFFWMGECLYTMGQYDEAEKFYIWVVDKYPESPKFDVSNYRIDLIKQKKIEAELLALLQWSHEESLRTSEDYQRKIRTYEYTLNLYQRRLSELNGGTNPMFQEMPDITTAPSTLETGSSYESLLEWARQMIGELEVMIKEREYGGSL